MWRSALKSFDRLGRFKHLKPRANKSMVQSIPEIPSDRHAFNLAHSSVFVPKGPFLSKWHHLIALPDRDYIRKYVLQHEIEFIAYIQQYSHYERQIMDLCVCLLHYFSCDLHPIPFIDAIVNDKWPNSEMLSSFTRESLLAWRILGWIHNHSNSYPSAVLQLACQICQCQGYNKQLQKLVSFIDKSVNTIHSSLENKIYNPNRRKKVETMQTFVERLHRLTERRESEKQEFLNERKYSHLADPVLADAMAKALLDVNYTPEKWTMEVIQAMFYAFLFRRDFSKAKQFCNAFLSHRREEAIIPLLTALLRIFLQLKESESENTLNELNLLFYSIVDAFQLNDRVYYHYSVGLYNRYSYITKHDNLFPSFVCRLLAAMEHTAVMRHERKILESASHALNWHNSWKWIQEERALFIKRGYYRGDHGVTPFPWHGSQVSWILSPLSWMHCTVHDLLPTNEPIDALPAEIGILLADYALQHRHFCLFRALFVKLQRNHTLSYTFDAQHLLSQAIRKCPPSKEKSLSSLLSRLFL